MRNKARKTSGLNLLATLRNPILIAIIFISAVGVSNAQSQFSGIADEKLPDRYFQLMDAGMSRMEKILSADTAISLASIESAPGMGHFPHVILIPAVLYTKKHTNNTLYGNERMLTLAIRIGDFLVAEYEKGHYTVRGDNDWDTYMWLEAYRLLQNKLGEERRRRWKEILLKEVVVKMPRLALCQDYPWYNAPFIGTSPNHYAIYASTLLVAGHVFAKPDWVQLATKVLRRFCVEEQTEDGYWGEHSAAGPTTGYDYITATQIALYWEYSKDPEALKALRRSTNFHKYFTYPNGTPVETINDRNRYWGVSMWGHFGFSHFSDGRRYAAFLTNFFPLPGDAGSYDVNVESLGRIAQNALYFHEGSSELIPQDLPKYAHMMKTPGGIRKTGPWVVSFSGIIAPQVTANNFFLDRQGNFSVFHKKTGLIISGANSKHQPELATFTEVIGNDSLHMPLSSRLQMNDSLDKLALSYNTFFAVLEVPSPSEKQLTCRFVTTHKWDDAAAALNIQLMLKAGETIETGRGQKIILSTEKIELNDDELGGLIKHNGWVLHLPKGMHLFWPYFPFNPYSNAPEKDVSKAIGRLFIPLKSENQEMLFRVDVD